MRQTGSGNDGRDRRSTSLEDVARLAGVSASTVSRVLAGSRPVGRELQKRVLDSAARLDYTPNPHARALARSVDASAGVVVHDLSDPYFSEIIRGVLEGAEASGRMVLICNTYRDAGRELEYIRHFRAQRLQVLILAGSGCIDRESEARLSAEIVRFEQAGGRAVLIGRHEVAADAVLPDNAAGARQVARHLVRLGHLRIGVITGPPELTTTFDRLVAFRDELAALNVALPDERVRSGGFDRSGGEAATGELLSKVPDLTAVFVLNDVMAIGALAHLRKRGVRVPEDISVVGFDDIPFATDLYPSLTTVRVPMTEIGRQAFALALEAPTTHVRSERIATELVVRESTGKPTPSNTRRTTGMPSGRGGRGKAGSGGEKGGSSLQG